MMRSLRSLLLLVSILCSSLSQSTEVTKIISSDLTELRRIGSNVEILEDRNGEFSPDSLFEADGFSQSKSEVPNLGITSSTFWIRFSIKNETPNDELLLELAYPIMDHVTFHQINENGIIESVQYGQDMSYEVRKYDHQNYIFDLNIQQGEQKTYLMSIKTGEQILVPLNVGTRQEIFEHNLGRDLISGLYFGIILVMAFYNLFIFLSTRDNSYMYYILYILFVGAVQACFQGYTFKYLWPNSTWLSINAIYYISAGSGIFGMIFAKEFIKTDQYAPKLNRGFYILHGLYAICLILTTSAVYDIGFNLMNLTAMSVSMYMIYAAFKVSRMGYRPAKFFLWAQTIFLLGVMIFVLRNFGVLPYNEFTYYILEIGSGIEVIVLSIALADRINILREEKEASQAQALSVSKENERIIREQNIILERTVEERTQELRKTNDELNVAMTNLKDAQSQLVSAEKMASLGQLTAGIAHEINNPINFVTSSVKPLKQNINEVLLILSKYGELSADEELKDKLKEIEELKDELEMNYLLDEINEIIESIDEGAQRTAEIVQGLRNFSHIDDIGVKEVNINQGITSTLKLLKSELSGVDIELNLGDIPKIECYGGKMNQVFLNIINNAVHAVKKSEKDNPQIKITSQLKKNLVTVEIEDNGVGISEDVKDKIFDPFFTTKDVGQGTGLGLSVVFGIIEQHNGSISVESEEGKGTKFIVNLPLKQVSEKSSENERSV